MSSQNLIIYKFTALYDILEELNLDLNFNITFADSENSLNEKLINSKNFIVISNKKYPDISNQFVLNNILQYSGIICGNGTDIRNHNWQ